MTNNHRVMLLADDIAMELGFTAHGSKEIRTTSGTKEYFHEIIKLGRINKYLFSI